MLKRITALIASAVMLTVPASALAVTADENDPSYTFDELLTMSGEEICGISEEYAEAYHHGEFALKAGEGAPFFTIYPYDDSPYLIPLDNTFYLDEDAMLTDLSIPKNAVDYVELQLGSYFLLPNDPEGTEYTEHRGYWIAVSQNEYNDYKLEEVFLRLFTVLEVHPKIAYVQPALCGGSAPEEPGGSPAAEPDYTFEKLLTMSKEEICGISEEIAETYTNLEKNIFLTTAPVPVSL